MVSLNMSQGFPESVSISVGSITHKKNIDNKGILFKCSRCPLYGNLSWEYAIGKGNMKKGARKSEFY